MSEFNSLSEAIAEWVERPLDELPAELKKRVESAFIASWDGLTDEQRLSVANQWDAQNDPANEEARQYWWDFFTRQQELENEIAEWEAKLTITSTDFATQKSNIESLKQELLAMEAEYQATLSDKDGEHYPKAENETPAQRKQRFEARYRWEKLRGPGALERTAKWAGIKRQTLAKILKRP